MEKYVRDIMSLFNIFSSSKNKNLQLSVRDYMDMNKLSFGSLFELTIPKIAVDVVDDGPDSYRFEISLSEKNYDYISVGFWYKKDRFQEEVDFERNFNVKHGQVLITQENTQGDPNSVLLSFQDMKNSKYSYALVRHVHDGGGLFLGTLLIQLQNKNYDQTGKQEILSINSSLVVGTEGK